MFYLHSIFLGRPAFNGNRPLNLSAFHLQNKVYMQSFDCLGFYIWLWVLWNIILLLEIQLKELLQSPITSQINRISCLSPFLHCSAYVELMAPKATAFESRTGWWKTIIYQLLSSLTWFIYNDCQPWLSINRHLENFLKLLSFPKRFLFNTFSESVGCSVASDSATPWTVAHQAPLSMKLSG